MAEELRLEQGLGDRCTVLAIALADLTPQVLRLGLEVAGLQRAFDRQEQHTMSSAIPSRFGIWRSVTTRSGGAALASSSAIAPSAAAVTS